MPHNSHVTNTLNDRKLNVTSDLPDLRDRIYEPALLDLQLAMSPPSPSISPILDQGTEGACTGFALASAINLQNNLRMVGLSSPTKVSPRMLYEMAKLHDEWPDEDYEGSSIRGALKGFFHNGACHDSLAPYISGEKDWFLSKEQAKNARQTGLGAYYRLRPQIIDYHAALNETGVVYVSAMIHRGWQNPKSGVIRKSTLHEGGHAFVIVGYNESGFLIQNSWGSDWGGYNGHSGVALWSYDDWAENVMDAWVLRLSVPTPEHFDLTHIPISLAERAAFEADKASAPKRSEIIGHFIHIDDGNLVERGRYATPIQTFQETADVFVADENRDGEKARYKHLLFYMHGGLNNRYASARRIRQMRDVYMRNGIYPVHFMWETGFFEELGDVLIGGSRKARERVGGIEDWADLMIEKFAKLPGRAIWREMKRDAKRSFEKGSGGFRAISMLLAGNSKRKNPMKVHFVGHSAGSILLAEFLRAKPSIDKALNIDSVSLMAPACTIDLYEDAFLPILGKSQGIASVDQYNLIDQRELDDRVGPYGKSLLYFVSRAFEDRTEMPLLGMEKYVSNLEVPKAHKIYHAGRDNSFTKSETHGGFDNDRTTMNKILTRVLSSKPSNKLAFQEHELKGY